MNRKMVCCTEKLVQSEAMSPKLWERLHSLRLSASLLLSRQLNKVYVPVIRSSSFVQYPQ